MRILTVENRSTKKLFHHIPHLIYQQNPYYIFPIRQEIEEIFTYNGSAPNKKEACRWIACDDDLIPKARIAAFVLSREKHPARTSSGGIGFFESVNDPIYSKVLFDTAMEWLAARRIKRIFAPINLGPRYQHWGLLTHNFQEPPFYGQSFNPEYYIDLFQRAGFQPAYKQYIYSISGNAELPEIYHKRAQRIFDNPHYHFKRYSHQQSDTFIRDFVYIYNKAWNQQAGYQALDIPTCKSLFFKFNAFIDPRFLLFAYADDQPIGCYIGVPDINEHLKVSSGNLTFLNKLRFLYLHHTRSYLKMIGIIFGIIPSFQKKGIESAFFYLLAQTLKEKPIYEQMLISWIGEFNPTMKRLIDVLGARHTKTLTTYEIFSSS